MRRKEIGITEHAVLYAVLAKALFQHADNAEHLLKEITESYGYRRGKSQWEETGIVGFLDLTE